MSNSIKTYCISLLGLVLALVLSRQAKAENLYNFPTHSKVKITRNPNGDSWLYLEFKWDEGCPPNFEKGKAIEFEIGILPKCFLRPKGGKDSEFDCNKIMGENGIYYNLPNEFIPDIGQDNCYVDLWNYWNPPASQVIDVLHAECDFDSSGDACASLATNIGAFLDKIGNFAVGLHDASTLQPGVMYSIRYPVEVNDSPACAGTMYETYANGNWCSSETPIWENRFSGYSTPGTYGASTTFYEGWGRAQVTMQTFKHSCDLPLPCDWVDKSYTCPHLIGAVDPNIGCIDAQKKTDFWLSSLCVPTDDYKFVPGLGYKESGATCTTRGHDSLTSTYIGNKKACCIDLDGDGYYGYSQKELYGSQTGDCNDDNEYFNPGEKEICGNYYDEDCDGYSPLICFSGAGGGYGEEGSCPEGSECETGSQVLTPCPNNIDSEHKICNDSCEWETITECPGSSCQPNTQQPCGNCGTMTCSPLGEWGSCLNQGACSPGQTQDQNCNSVGTQTKTCSASCAWNGWGTCSAECVPGNTQDQSCNGGNGTQTKTCQSNGQWGNWGACVPSCQDTYIASSLSACSANPQASGNPTLCLNVQQNSGSSWRYQVCKQGGAFQQTFNQQLRDANHSLFYTVQAESAGISCTAWKNFSVGHIPGNGVFNGAGLTAHISSPSNCTQAACQYKTGSITIFKECQ